MYRRRGCLSRTASLRCWEGGWGGLKEMGWKLACMYLWHSAENGAVPCRADRGCCAKTGGALRVLNIDNNLRRWLSIMIVKAVSIGRNAASCRYAIINFLHVSTAAMSS